MRSAWCRVLTRIGDLPGMNHVGTVRGQSALGRSPEAAQTSTVVKFTGKLRTGSANEGSWTSIASTTRKKSGAATCTPTNAGFPAPLFFRVVDAIEVQERSEEHTSELQSLAYLVCRLLLEKK